MKVTTTKSISCVKQSPSRLMAGWHCAFRGGGIVGKEE
jgi:hypothetical protein